MTVINFPKGEKTVTDRKMSAEELNAYEGALRSVREAMRNGDPVIVLRDIGTGTKMEATHVNCELGTAAELVVNYIFESEPLIEKSMRLINIGLMAKIIGA